MISHGVFIDTTRLGLKGDLWGRNRQHASKVEVGSGRVIDLGYYTGRTVTYRIFISSLPYEALRHHPVSLIQLQGLVGQHRAAHAADRDPVVHRPNAVKNWPNRLQRKSIRPIFDGARPVGDRVVNVTVRCIECSVPRYEPLQLNKTYRVVSHNFMGQGGAGYTKVDNSLYLNKTCAALRKGTHAHTHTTGVPELLSVLHTTPSRDVSVLLPYLSHPETAISIRPPIFPTSYSLLLAPKFIKINIRGN
ncbi:Apyrase [Eumeta japonica]|uniref:5'-nucleotidase n=1 Tax=Eumeta variegata TaxID=151549 RepID=A0A4C1TNJ6_EUMVA|nr:Apyrase [Eumeta japonica]